jgi:hypothetical protein
MFHFFVEYQSFWHYVIAVLVGWLVGWTTRGILDSMIKKIEDE